MPGGFILGGVVLGLSWRWWTAFAGRGRTWPGCMVPGARWTLSDAVPSPEKERDKERVMNLYLVQIVSVQYKYLASKLFHVSLNQRW